MVCGEFGHDGEAAVDVVQIDVGILEVADLQGGVDGA